MIMPMPYYIKAGGRFVYGTVDLTVGDAFGAIYGYDSDLFFGSLSSNTLFSIDTVATTPASMYSTSSNNYLEWDLASSADAADALADIQANFTELRDADSTFVIYTADFVNGGDEFIYSDAVAGARVRFGAADVGNTFTLGWY